MLLLLVPDLLILLLVLVLLLVLKELLLLLNVLLLQVLLCRHIWHIVRMGLGHCWLCAILASCLCEVGHLPDLALWHMIG